MRGAGTLMPGVPVTPRATRNRIATAMKTMTVCINAMAADSSELDD